MRAVHEVRQSLIDQILEGRAGQARACLCDGLAATTNGSPLIARRHLRRQPFSGSSGDESYASSPARGVANETSPYQRPDYWVIAVVPRPELVPDHGGFHCCWLSHIAPCEFK